MHMHTHIDMLHIQTGTGTGAGIVIGIETETVTGKRIGGGMARGTESARETETKKEDIGEARKGCMLCMSMLMTDVESACVCRLIVRLQERRKERRGPRS
jgi:hypothetical protein